MAGRPARRLLIDAVFASLVVGTALLAYVYGGTPRMPEDVCATTTGGPRYAELLADGRITIAAVIGQLTDNPHDFNVWSATALAEGLRRRRFVETAPGHFEAGELAVDIAVYPYDNARIARALDAAFATHDVVYFTGHSNAGRLAFAVPAAYRIALLDTCWSTQLYSARVIGPDRDVIGNTEKSVTGSVESLLVAIDALRVHAPTWQPIIDTMNARAEARAGIRSAGSRYKVPEHYRLDSSCHGKSAGQHGSR